MSYWRRFVARLLVVLLLGASPGCTILVGAAGAGTGALIGEGVNDDPGEGASVGVAVGIFLGIIIDCIVLKEYFGGLKGSYPS